ncbi:MAG: flavodoxin family protein [Patescibacteria group bacterium]
MPKTLIISASPRKQNTDFILGEILKNVSGQKEFIKLSTKNIKTCLGCSACQKKFGCVIKDDMTEIYKKLIWADTVVIGTPDYFGNVSGIMKNFIDRCHTFYKYKKLKTKKLILIMTGGQSTPNVLKDLKNSTWCFAKYVFWGEPRYFAFGDMDDVDVKKDNKVLSHITKIVKQINK